MDLYFLKNKLAGRKIKKPGPAGIYWLAALVVLVILLMSGSQPFRVFNLWPEEQQLKSEVIPEQPDNLSGAPLIRLQGTYLRTGLVTDKTTSQLVMESPKLKGSGMDILKVAINQATPVVEIRIPQILSQEPLGDKRPETIERRAVSLENVKVGQVVSVLASEDIADKLEFSASRIEYSKIVIF
ncbi:MAG: hypothetical protein ACOZAJ_03025 [Patescibacteria group bacterium]